MYIKMQVYIHVVVGKTLNEDMLVNKLKTIFLKWIPVTPDHIIDVRYIRNIIEHQQLVSPFINDCFMMSSLSLMH